jgi:succinate dehydrogenase / fumarate reductase, cytochrome b subunit
MQKPLSPHLQIYSPQLTSVMSILHRLTGLGFVAALILTCVWLYSLSDGYLTYNDFCTFTEHPAAKLMLYLVLASVYYHLLNGVRYLMWSIGEGFELRTVYNTGWIVSALVFTLTVLTVFLV